MLRMQFSSTTSVKNGGVWGNKVWRSIGSVNKVLIKDVQTFSELLRGRGLWEHQER